MKSDEFHVKSSNSSQLNIYKFNPDSMKIVRINQKQLHVSVFMSRGNEIHLNLYFQNNYFENHDFDDFC